MQRRMTRPIRVLATLLALLGFALPVAPALSQTESQTTTLVWVDSPAEGATLTSGTRVDVGGWAVDAAGPGAGVDMVRIYLDGRPEAGGTLIGNADYGRARPDVAAALGNPAFTNAGFNYLWTLAGVSGGAHTLYVYAHSATNGWTHQAVNVTVSAASTPMPEPSTGYYRGAYPPPPPGLVPVPSYPPYRLYPPHPGYRPPSYPSTPPSGRVCIMIYPTPPECLLP